MRIGVDLGGTKIEGVALGKNGHAAARRRVPTPRNDYLGALEAIAHLVGELEREAGAAATVGVGMPGAVSTRTGLVKNANSTWLNGRPFAEDLARRLRRPVRTANDANCFALSEAADGAAAGLPVVFGVILGTGVGGGLVVGGALIEGANRIAGEWGHNVLPGESADANPCYCGKRGCVESWLSGPAFQADAGGGRSAADIASAAEKGEPVAVAALDRYVARLARALSIVVNVVDPDAIVLGGGMSNVDRLYRDVPPLLSDAAFSDGIDVRLLKNRHGDSSGVRGAAWLWPDPS